MEEMWCHIEGVHVNASYEIFAENQRNEPLQWLGNPAHMQGSESVVAKVQPCGKTW